MGLWVVSKRRLVATTAPQFSRFCKSHCGGCSSYYSDVAAPDPGCVQNRAYISRSKHGAVVERTSAVASS